MVSFDLSINIDEKILKLLSKSNEVIIQKRDNKLILNGVKDIFYCVVLNEGSFYAEDNVSLILSLKTNLSFLEVDDILRISKNVLSIEKTKTKEVITLITSSVKDYSGNVQYYEAKSKQDNRLLLECLKALSDKVPGSIDNVRFINNNVFIKSIFSLIVMQGNEWSLDASVPYKMLTGNLTDGYIMQENENTIIMNTDIVSYFPSIKTTDIAIPNLDFECIVNDAEFETKECKNLLSMISTIDFNESSLILNDKKLSVQMRSDNMIVNPTMKGNATLVLGSMQIYTVLKLFSKMKFSIYYGNGVFRFTSNTQKNSVSLFCSGKVVNNDTKRAYN